RVASRSDHVATWMGDTPTVAEVGCGPDSLPTHAPLEVWPAKPLRPRSVSLCVSGVLGSGAAARVLDFVDYLNGRWRHAACRSRSAPTGSMPRDALVPQMQQCVIAQVSLVPLAQATPQDDAPREFLAHAGSFALCFKLHAASQDVLPSVIKCGD